MSRSTENYKKWFEYAEKPAGDGQQVTAIVDLDETLVIYTESSLGPYTPAAPSKFSALSGGKHRSGIEFVDVHAFSELRKFQDRGHRVKVVTAGAYSYEHIQEIFQLYNISLAKNDYHNRIHFLSKNFDRFQKARYIDSISGFDENHMLFDDCRENRPSKCSFRHIKLTEKFPSLDQKGYQNADYWVSVGVDHCETAKRSNAQEGYKDAKLCFEKAFEFDLNHGSANYHLGLLFKNELGVVKDLTKAEEFFKRARANGHLEARRQLLKIEMEKTKPIPTAADWGSWGVDYHNASNGRARDFIDARLCNEEALKLDPNYLHANYNLGLIFKEGLGIAQDLTKAEALFNKAKVNGCLNSRCQLLKIEMEKTKLIPTADAWCSLGVDYHNARKDKKLDRIDAKLCYEEALKFDPNHTNANYNLGLIFYYGLGVVRDLTKAEALFNIAKANGFFDARRQLLKIEIKKTKPKSTADDWFHLGVSYHDETSDKAQDYINARLCYEGALKLDPKHVGANYKLGLIFKEGLDVVQDPAKAKEFFDKARENDSFGVEGPRLFTRGTQETANASSERNDVSFERGLPH